MKPFALTAAVEEGADPATTYYTSKPLSIYLGPGRAAGLERVDLLAHLRRRDQPGAGHLAVGQHGLRPACPGPWARQDRRRGPRHGHHEPPDALALDRAGHRGRHPLEVADAYATLAAEGIHHTPRRSPRWSFPTAAARAKVRGKRVIPAGVAYVVDQILQGNTRYGTAAAMPNYYTGVAAGKTGTTENSADAWFCGFDPKLATAVWMGYPQAEIPMPGVQGATYCVPDLGHLLQPGLRQPGRRPTSRARR